MHCVLHFLLILYTITCILCHNSEYFKAAVFDEVLERDELYGVQRNLKQFNQAANEAALKKTDIIVFPECGIFPCTENRSLYRKYAERIPDPKDVSWNPCDELSDDYPILNNLSCMAKNNKMFVVANLIDKKPCNSTKTCREDKVKLFNTDVAFDKSGTLVARYHKRFLYFEDQVDRPELPNYVWFDTEFGRFGLITCFDIIYKEPIELVEKYNVDTIVTPSWWGNDLPYYLANQIFFGWAKSQHVNLLLSNIQDVKTNSAGSGIYSRFLGVVNYNHKRTNKSSILTANIPVHKNRNQKARKLSANHVNYTGNIYADITNFTTVKLNKSEDNLTVCNNGLCCNLRYKISKLDDLFFFSSFSGLRSVLGRYIWYEEVCLVYACSDNKETVCSRIPSHTLTKFKNFYMEGNFSTKYVNPSIVGQDFQPFPNFSWKYSNVDKNAKLWYNRKQSMVIATLFGRVFNKDPPYHP